MLWRHQGGHQGGNHGVTKGDTKSDTKRVKILKYFVLLTYFVDVLILKLDNKLLVDALLLLRFAVVFTDSG